MDTGVAALEYQPAVVEIPPREYKLGVLRMVAAMMVQAELEAAGNVYRTTWGRQAGSPAFRQAVTDDARAFLAYMRG